MTSTSTVGRKLARLLLWIGIIILPFIFAWLTLAKNKGFTWRARVIAFGWLSLFLFVVWKSPNPKPLPARTSSETAANIDHKQADQKSNDNTSSKPTTPTPDVSPTIPDHTLNVMEARAVMIAILATAKPCDDAGDWVTKSLSARDVQSLYENAEAAKSNCLHVATSLNDIVLPAHAAPQVQAALKDSIDQMALAYTMKSENYSDISDAANNGLTSIHPSEVLELRQRASAIQYKQLAAIAGIYAAFESEGVSIQDASDVKKAPARRAHPRTKQ